MNSFFTSIDDFRESIECGEEFNLKLNGIEYYIGYSGDVNVISEPFGVNEKKFNTFEELLDIDLHGTTLRESWMLLTA
ncbi:TPA: hypothetical protein U1W10_000958 [Streptococcus suis]|nr:hypothetical protein [Streptococcus suis]NQN67497.1 hypothetical protein [Streptococcus suis]HEM4050974.1 hypothetical protein [Streptococcus suis]